ncbi:hypothetical protein ACFUTU_17740 [Arthrobacter sp. NPDC057388]|uniref:hypothetical protein n=1 Tax=Arthrobacter sp. NPDC057388 TaxID=3346116 RepID=UPI0036277F16
MTGPADRHDDGGRLAALLLLAGVVVSLGFGALHPGEADPNGLAAGKLPAAGIASGPASPCA